MRDAPDLVPSYGFTDLRFEVYYLFRISTFGFRIFCLPHGFHRCHQLNDGGLLIQGIQPQHGSLGRGRLSLQGMFNSPQLLDGEQFLAGAATGSNAC